MLLLMRTSLGHPIKNGRQSCANQTSGLSIDSGDGDLSQSLRRRLLWLGFSPFGRFLIVSLGSGLVFCYLLKNFFLRERPKVVPHLAHFDVGSFPSGHSMGAAVVYLTLGGILSRQTRRLLKKAYFLSVALVLTVLVGISR